MHAVNITRRGLIEHVSLSMLRYGGWIILASASVIVVDMFSRRYYGFSLDADELGAYALAIGATWAYANTLEARAHIRIDTLYFRFPTRLRPYLDCIALLAMALFFGLLTYRAMELTYFSFTYGSRSPTPLRVPLWIPQGLWCLGLIQLMLVIVSLLLKLIKALARQDMHTAGRIAGLATIDDELAQELDDLGRRSQGQKP